MVHVIGYTYEADTHCICCTKYRFGNAEKRSDENGVPFLTGDMAGNFVCAVFDTDAGLAPINCGTCGDNVYTAQGAELERKIIC